MKQILAERLLAKVMNWDDDQVKTELRPLMLLAEIKYDEYHQFGPGMRFIERLARWLSQLRGIDLNETLALRQTAFSVVRDHLIFVSSDEMFSLIGMAYPEYILPRQRAIAAVKLNCPRHLINRIKNSDAFGELITKTLYVGLSDGSQIGMLRRMNPGTIDHEFTLLNYDPTPEKTASIGEKLRASLNSQGLPSSDPRFEFIVLVDDFTASGTSFIRKEDGEYAGKLTKVLKNLTDGNSLSTLVDPSNVQIMVLFYVSTQVALDNIRAKVATFKTEMNCNIEITVDAIHIIPSGAMRIGADNAVVDAFLLARFEIFKNSIVDEHWKKGDCSSEHRGFNSGDLALILFHNSPNNSLPVLWYDQEGKNDALFPRTTRHGRR